jgi:cell wall-associated NlpC family hydrolase
MKNFKTIMLLATTIASLNGAIPDDFDDNDTVYEPTIMEQLIYIREMQADDVSHKINKVIKYATQRVLQPYTWGGSYKWDKYDCSSLVQGAYASIGVKIPRTATAQYRYLKSDIKTGDIKEGDLIYYLTTKKRKLPVTHVTLYIGKGKMIEAKGKKQGIIVSNFTTKRLVSIKRVVTR